MKIWILSGVSGGCIFHSFLYQMLITVIMYFLSALHFPLLGIVTDRRTVSTKEYLLLISCHLGIFTGLFLAYCQPHSLVFKVILWKCQRKKYFSYFRNTGLLRQGNDRFYFAVPGFMCEINNSMKGISWELLALLTPKAKNLPLSVNLSLTPPLLRPGS